MKRSLRAVALVTSILSIACGGSPRPSAPPVPPAASASPMAQAPTIRVGPAVTVGSKVPAYGCIGFSPSQKLAACVVGVSGVGLVVPGKVTLGFAPLANDVDEPNAIAIVEDQDQALVPGELPLAPVLRQRLASVLTGFFTWEPVATLDANGQRSSVEVSNITIAISKRKVQEAGENEAERFDTKLEVKARGKATTLDERAGIAASRYAVRVFEANGGIVVERTLSTAEEGIYMTDVDAWWCRGDVCGSVSSEAPRAKPTVSEERWEFRPMSHPITNHPPIPDRKSVALSACREALITVTHGRLVVDAPDLRSDGHLELSENESLHATGRGSFTLTAFGPTSASARFVEPGLCTKEAPLNLERVRVKHAVQR